MAIVGLQTIVVADDYKIAISASLFGSAGIAYDSVKRGTDGIANRKGQVDSVMGPAAAELEARMNLCQVRGAIAVEFVGQKQVD